MNTVVIATMAVQISLTVSLVSTQSSSFTNSDYTASCNAVTAVNNELGSIWQEMVVIKFEGVSPIFAWRYREQSRKKVRTAVYRSRFEPGSYQISSSGDSHINKITTLVLFVELRRALYQSVADSTLLTHSQFCGGPTGTVDRRKTKTIHTPLMAQSWHFCKNHYFYPDFPCFLGL
jgi:hypothetical protein